MFAAPAIVSMLLMLLAPAAPAVSFVGVQAVDPPVEPASLGPLTLNGNGCPEGTADAGLAPGNAALVVGFANYVATAGRGAKPVDSRRNCQLNVKVTAPAGYTFAIAGADLAGVAHVEKGAVARVRSTVYSAGMAPVPLQSYTIEGPHGGGWVWSYGKKSEELAWYPCGGSRYVNINTELRIIVGTSDPESTTSSISFQPPEGGASAVYHLRWARCPG